MRLFSKILLGFLLGISIISVSLLGSLSLNKLLNEDYQGIILDDSYFQSAPRDPFTIKSIMVDKDILKVEVTYGGGCKDHEFVLIGSNVFMESDPVQTKVVLSHNANNDLCEKLILEELEFDLSPLKHTYQQSYSDASAEIIIHFEGVEETISYQF